MADLAQLLEVGGRGRGTQGVDLLASIPEEDRDEVLKVLFDDYRESALGHACSAPVRVRQALRSTRDRAALPKR